MTSSTLSVKFTSASISCEGGEGTPRENREYKDEGVLREISGM